LKFNGGPIVRSLVVSLVLLVAFAAVTNVAMAREIRVFPVPNPFNTGGLCASGVVDAKTTPTVTADYTGCDLVRAAAGFAPATGPDAGITPQPGDTIVLAPGVYTLAAAQLGFGFPFGTVPPAGLSAGAPANGTGPVVVPGPSIGGSAPGVAVALVAGPGVGLFSGFPTQRNGQGMEALMIRSRDGAQVTVIRSKTDPETFFGGVAAGTTPGLGQVVNRLALPGGIFPVQAITDDACVILAADTLTFGGDRADQGITVEKCPGPGIIMGQPSVNGTYGNAPAPALGASLGIGPAVAIIDLTGSSGADEDMTIQNNFIQQNYTDGLRMEFGVVAGGRTFQNIRIDNNEFRGNGVFIQQTFVPNVGDVADGNGIFLSTSVGSLGGASEDEGIFITNNIIDSNMLNGVVFNNTGDEEQVVFQGNTILRNGDNGVLWTPNVTQLQTILFDGNLIKRNGLMQTGPATFGAGVAFFNNGQIQDAIFTGNRNDAFDEGISGNGGSGVLFGNTRAFPAGLTVARDA